MQTDDPYAPQLFYTLLDKGANGREFVAGLFTKGAEALDYALRSRYPGNKRILCRIDDGEEKEVWPCRSTAS